MQFAIVRLSLKKNSYKWKLYVIGYTRKYQGAYKEFKFTKFMF